MWDERRGVGERGVGSEERGRWGWTVRRRDGLSEGRGIGYVEGMTGVSELDGEGDNGCSVSEKLIEAERG